MGLGIAVRGFPSQVRSIGQKIFGMAGVDNFGVLNMNALIIRPNPNLEKKTLNRLARATGKSKSEMARDALKREVAVTRLRALRRRVLPFAEAQGLPTDEDIFRVVSRGCFWTRTSRLVCLQHVGSVPCCQIYHRPATSGFLAWEFCAPHGVPSDTDAHVHMIANSHPTRLTTWPLGSNF